MDQLEKLETQSVYILREAYREFKQLVDYYYDDISQADLFREAPSYQRLQLDLIFSF
jgi:hypothetical protein